MEEKKKVPVSLRIYRKYALRFHYLTVMSVLFFTAFSAVINIAMGWGFFNMGIIVLLITVIVLAAVLMVLATFWYFAAVYKLRL
jgi:hypothetical protein